MLNHNSKTFKPIFRHIFLALCFALTLSPAALNAEKKRSIGLDTLYQEGLSFLEKKESVKALARFRQAFYQKPWSPTLRKAYFLSRHRSKASSPYFIFENATSVLPHFLLVLALTICLAFCIWYSFSKKRLHIFYLLNLPLLFIVFWNVKHQSLPVATLVKSESFRLAPHPQAKVESYARAGSLVLIKLETEKWLFAQKNKIRGWIPKHSVYPQNSFLKKPTSSGTP